MVSLGNSLCHLLSEVPEELSHHAGTFDWLLGWLGRHPTELGERLRYSQSLQLLLPRRLLGQLLIASLTQC